MIKSKLSFMALAAGLFAASPVFADDATQQSINTLSDQVQKQQAEIEQLKKSLHEKKATAAKAAKVQAVQAPASDADYHDASDINAQQNQNQQKPSVVAPLQPTSLGTLSVDKRSLNGVSQDQHAVVAQPVVQQLHAPAVAQVSGAQVAPTAAVATSTTTTTVSSPVVPATLSPPPVAYAANNSNQNSVGQAPPQSDRPPEVQALSNVGGVLTPYGKAIIEPFMEYSRSSVNTFLFNGVEVVDALLIGAVEANRTSRDLLSAGVTGRVGVSDRMELEARIPFVYRQDQVTNTVANTNGLTTTSSAEGYGLGDVELAAHYQINDGHNDWPFFIANMRYKSDTGSNPYTAQFRPSDNSERTLGTGSGFNAIEPSLTVIYPSDPATLFANVGYIHSFDRDINGLVAGNYVGNVAPGDTFSGSLGMGIALNDRLSFTVGYEHDYIRPTATVVSGSTQYSPVLQVGSALSGLSYRINDTTSIAFNMAAGVTQDAPDVVLGVRVPILLNAF